MPIDGVAFFWMATGVIGLRDFGLRVLAEFTGNDFTILATMVVVNE